MIGISYWHLHWKPIRVESGMNTCPEIKKIIIFTQCRKITLILAILLPLFICAQNFQMTIKPGTLANAVKATVRPGLPIDGRFSSAQICFIVSTSVGARPVISIVQISFPEWIILYSNLLNIIGRNLICLVIWWHRILYPYLCRRQAGFPFQTRRQYRKQWTLNPIFTFSQGHLLPKSGIWWIHSKYPNS